MMQPSILDILNTNKQGVGVLCKRFNVTRGAIYQSINGYGSREIRVQIALIVDMKPSLLWSNNDAQSLKLDDALFNSYAVTNNALENMMRSAKYG